MEDVNDSVSPKYFGVITSAIVMPVSLVVYHFSDADRAISTFCFLGVVVFAALVKWELRGKVWFWVSLLMITALHLPLIRSIHWPVHSVHGIILLPLFVVDLLIVLGIIRLAKYVSEAKGSN